MRASQISSNLADKGINMAISTQDCKDFISSIASIIGASEGDKWKRARKYSLENLVLRDFESQDGRVLTICENNGELSLYQLQAPEVSKEIKVERRPDELGMKYIGRKAKEDDIKKFLAECAIADPEIVYEDAQETAKDANEWENLEYDGKGLTPREWMENWGSDRFTLFHLDANDDYRHLKTKDVYRVHMFFLPAFDTSYRFSIYETKDHYLYLGQNDPD